MDPISKAGNSASEMQISLRVAGPTGTSQPLIIREDYCTIGASEHCDIRIPAPGIPPVHSLLRIGPGYAWIEPAAAGGLITVNKIAVKRLALRSGDQIDLGPVSLEVCVEPIQEAAHPWPQLKGPTEPADLGKLTANELCDLIGAEQAEIDRFDQQREFGWQALLAAAHTLATTSLPTESVSTSDLVSQIEQLSKLLEEQTREMVGQENDLVAAVASLRHRQQSLQSQLDQLLASPDAAHKAGSWRVSA
jgi:hypothetical protein